MNKRLIYTFSIDGERKTSNLTEMLVNSLRHAGYLDDIVVFSNGWTSPKCTTIDIETSNNARRGLYNSDRGPGTLSSIWALRTTINNKLDLSQYSQILYLDSDILAFGNINEFFKEFDNSNIHIQIEPIKLRDNYGTYQTLLLTPEEFLQFKDVLSVCAGIVLIPGGIANKFFKTWQEMISKYLQCGFAAEQAALQAMRLRKTFNIEPFPLDVGRGKYFKHYQWWLGCKKYSTKVQWMSNDYKGLGIT